MASTEKLRSGRYRGVYYDSSGKKRHTPTVDRKRDALSAARTAEAKAKRVSAAAAGELPGHTKYKDWYPVWWDGRTIEPYTAIRETEVMNLHVLPRWADEEMARIAQRAVQAWVNELLGRGYSPAYVKRIYTPFRGSMTAAVGPVLDASPCVGIKIKGLGVKTSDERIYADSELDRIHARLTKRNSIVFRFIEETGLRPAELCGLHRHRIDRSTGWLTTAEVYERTGMIKPYPKDDEAREIPLTSRALRLLDEWDELFPPTEQKCGLPHRLGRCRSDLQFRQRNGKNFTPKNLWSLWQGAQRGAKIHDPGSPYDLRHLLATRMAEAGVDPWAIMRILGHSSLDQSADYIHRTASERMRILKALGDPAARHLTLVSTTQNDPSIPPESHPSHG